MLHSMMLGGCVVKPGLPVMPGSHHKPAPSAQALVTTQRLSPLRYGMMKHRHKLSCKQHIWQLTRTRATAPGHLLIDFVAPAVRMQIPAALVRHHNGQVVTGQDDLMVCRKRAGTWRVMDGNSCRRDWVDFDLAAVQLHNIVAYS